MRDLEQQLAEPDDGVHGCAELVADVGEELALDPGRLEQQGVALGQLRDLHVQGGVVGVQLLLGALEFGEHAVERLGQLLELVAGLDLRSDGQIALADPLGRVLELADGVEDEPVNDEVEHEHGQCEDDAACDDEVEGVDGEHAGGGGGSVHGDEQTLDGLVVGPERTGVVVDECQRAPVRLVVVAAGGISLQCGQGAGGESLAASRLGRVVRQPHPHLDPAELGRAGGEPALVVGGVDPGVHEASRDLELALVDQGVHPQPGEEQGDGDDEDHGGSEDQQALVGQRDRDVAHPRELHRRV